jgi:hypothetical protein
MPLTVEGRGLIDCELYAQPGRAVLHLVNLTSAGPWRAPIDELVPVGPLKVGLRLPQGVKGSRARLLVAGTAVPVKAEGGKATFEVRSVLDHEVVVID